MLNYLKKFEMKNTIHRQKSQGKELSDDELAMIVGGVNSTPVAPEQGPNPSANLTSSQQLNRTGYAIGG
jgi:bacteriocin-like protein